MGANITEKEVSKVLRTLGVSTMCKGYFYIKTSMLLISQNEEYLHCIIHGLYPAIAKIYNVHPRSVERCIRYVVDCLYYDERPEILQSITHLVSYKRKPSNGSFIGALYEYLKYEEKEGEL